MVSHDLARLDLIKTPSSEAREQRTRRQSRRLRFPTSSRAFAAQRSLEVNDITKTSVLLTGDGDMAELVMALLPAGGASQPSGVLQAVR